MAVTKRKAESFWVPCWQVVRDGKPTELFIMKGEDPKYRQPQMYDVMRGSGPDANHLFEVNGVSGAMAVINQIMSA